MKKPPFDRLSIAGVSWDKPHTNATRTTTVLLTREYRREQGRAPPVVCRNVSIAECLKRVGISLFPIFLTLDTIYSLLNWMPFVIVIPWRGLIFYFFLNIKETWYINQIWTKYIEIVIKTLTLKNLPSIFVYFHVSGNFKSKWNSNLANHTQNKTG